MWSLVKMNDLEDQVEPLLSRAMGASSSTDYKGEAMDIEKSVGMQDEACLVEELNLGGSHGGTKFHVG